jgi:hypothetical protein
MADEVLEFVADGDPVPQGSMTAFPYLEGCDACRPGRPCGRRNCWHGRVARARVTHDDDGKMKAWREFVALQARNAMVVARWPTRPAFNEGEPAVIGLVFDLVRPKGHYLPSGALSADGRRYPYPTREHSGDVDKLLRAALDGLTGVLWPTDAQVIVPIPGKRWAPGQPKQGRLRAWVARVPDLRLVMDKVAACISGTTNLELFT